MHNEPRHRPLVSLPLHLGVNVFNQVSSSIKLNYTTCNWSNMDCKFQCEAEVRFDTLFFRLICRLANVNFSSCPSFDIPNLVISCGSQLLSIL